MVDDEVGRSPHYTPAASSISTSPCRMATSTPSHTAPRGSQQKRRRIGRGEELDDAICEGLRESRKRWERKAEAEAAEKNAEMYFGKNVGETLRLMTKRPLPKPGFSRCCWRWSSLHNNPTSLPSHSTSNYFGTYSNYEL